MDEEELEIYLNQIDALERERIWHDKTSLRADARDEDGYVVPGCSYILPAPTEA